MWRRFLITIAVEFPTDSEVEVIADLDGLVPKVKGKGLTQRAKNGEVDVQFFKQSFNMIAAVKDEKGARSYRLDIRRLPNRITPRSCSWKLESGRAVITLVKEPEKGKDGKEFYTDWKPTVMANLLDQYDSSEDEDGNTPDTKFFELQSKKLEELGLRVEMGADNNFEIDADDAAKLPF